MEMCDCDGFNFIFKCFMTSMLDICSFECESKLEIKVQQQFVPLYTIFIQSFFFAYIVLLRFYNADSLKNKQIIVSTHEVFCILLWKTMLHYNPWKCCFYIIWTHKVYKMNVLYLKYHLYFMLMKNWFPWFCIGNRSKASGIYNIIV